MGMVLPVKRMSLLGRFGNLILKTLGSFTRGKMGPRNAVGGSNKNQG